MSTFEHRSFELADNPMIFAADRPGDPQLHLQPHHPVRKVNQGLRQTQRRNFKIGVTDIGYGLRPNHPLEQVATSNGYPAPRQAEGRSQRTRRITSIEFAKFVSGIQPGQGLAEALRRAEDRLKALAELYADPNRKVMSFWTMGFNQHTRGTWVNNMIYNVHLLVGKIRAGQQPVPLTGQPSACGTAREVGTFAHRLPADMVVTNPSTARSPRRSGSCPEGTISDKIGYHAGGSRARMLKDGKIGCYWTSTTNNMQAGPNVNGRSAGLAQSGKASSWSPTSTRPSPQWRPT